MVPAENATCRPLGRDRGTSGTMPGGMDPMRRPPLFSIASRIGWLPPTTLVPALSTVNVRRSVPLDPS